MSSFFAHLFLNRYNLDSLIKYIEITFKNLRPIPSFFLDQGDNSLERS
jgi:hypothetical protein